MDNLTHSLVGLAAAKAGLERTSPYATVVCVVAANLPDADIVALAGGQSFYLEHHRGITHSIVGTLALALLLPALFVAGERALARLRGRKPRARLKGLLLSSLVLSASHPLLDWTNSYGVRPLLPWDGRWFYGDLVFVLDPWIWLTVGGACFLMTARTRLRTALWAALAVAVTLALVLLPRRVGAGVPAGGYVFWFAGLAACVLLRRLKVERRWGAGLAAGALALVVAYWGGLSLLHARAFTRATDEARKLTGRGGETVSRLAAMPRFGDPLSWRCAAETERAAWRFDVSLAEGSGGVRNVVRVERPQGEEAELVERASQNEHARVLLDFARFPVARVSPGVGTALVRFADLRFTEPGSPSGGSSFKLDVPVAAGEP